MKRQGGDMLEKYAALLDGEEKEEVERMVNVVKRHGDLVGKKGLIDMVREADRMANLMVAGENMVEFEEEYVRSKVETGVYRIGSFDGEVLEQFLQGGLVDYRRWSDDQKYNWSNPWLTSLAFCRNLSEIGRDVLAASGAMVDLVGWVAKMYVENGELMNQDDVITAIKKVGGEDFLERVIGKRQELGEGVPIELVAVTEQFIDEGWLSTKQGESLLRGVVSVGNGVGG